MTSSPKVLQVDIPLSAQKIEAQLYLPAGKAPFRALILVPGYPSNIDDPQLQHLGEALARIDIAVLIPKLSALSNGYISTEDTNTLVESFRWLAARSDIRANHIGFAGFCIGGSLALVAAQDTRINTKVSVVYAFGGYYSLRDFTFAVATHTSHTPQGDTPWEPAQTSTVLFALNALQFLDNHERTQVAQSLNSSQRFTRQTGQLSTNGERIYTLLTETNPQRINMLLDSLPVEQQTWFRNLSPSTNMAHLHAKLFLMHDRNDPYIPATESYHMRMALQESPQLVYQEFDIFKHMMLASSTSRLQLVIESSRLALFVRQIIIAL